MRCSCCPEGRVRGRAGTSGWNGLRGSGCGEEPLLLLWQLERSLIIAALTAMSNCKENYLANLLEGSAGGRSWLWGAECLPASPRGGLWLRCHISPVPAAGVQNHIKDGEGKVGVMEAGWGWAGRSGWGTCGRWVGHTEEQQEKAAKKDRNSRHLLSRARTSRDVVSAQA